MGTALLVLIGIGVVIGIRAQVSKERTGIAWEFLTFVILFILFFMAFGLT